MKVEANAPGKKIAPGASPIGLGLVQLLFLWLSVSLVFVTTQARKPPETLPLLEMPAQLFYLIESYMVHSCVMPEVVPCFKLFVTFIARYDKYMAG